MRKIIVFIIILLIVAAGVIFFVINKNDESSNKTSNESSSDYIIELDANHTTGYTWKYEVSEDGIVEVKNEYVQNEHEEGVVGFGGKDRFTIKGIKEGTTTIKFTYSQAWEPKADDKTETYVITVDKDLKVTGKAQ